MVATPEWLPPLTCPPPHSYFLTHFHADHYGGLTKDWNAGVIYCSKATARLVHTKIHVPQRFIVPLPMGEPVDVLDSQSQRTGHKVYLLGKSFISIQQYQ